MLYPETGMCKRAYARGECGILKGMMRTFRALVAISMIVAALSGPLTARAGILDDIKRDIRQKEEEIRKLEEEKKRFSMTIGEKQKAQQNLKNQIGLLTAEIEKLRVQQRITEQKISSTCTNKPLKSSMQFL